MSDIIKNQEQVFIHLQLQDDLAYQYSIENNDVINMQMVLRAHGEGHSFEQAEKQIEVANEFEAA